MKINAWIVTDTQFIFLFETEVMHFQEEDNIGHIVLYDHEAKELSDVIGEVLSPVVDVQEPSGVLDDPENEG